MTDEEFLNVLNQHERLLYSICHTFCRADREEMQDLYQDILFGLWRSRDSYRDLCSAKNWIYRVALNTAISLRRKKSVRPVVIPLPEEMEFWLAEEGPDGLHEELYALIDQLSNADKALIFLYLDGASEHDMAETMGLSVSNIGTRIHRIKQKLKTLNTDK